MRSASPFPRRSASQLRATLRTLPLNFPPLLTLGLPCSPSLGPSSAPHLIPSPLSRPSASFGTDPGSAEWSRANPLPDLPTAPDAPVPSYRSKFLSLQREQHSLLASLPLRKPERVAQLVVEKDAALAALVDAQAAAQLNSEALYPAPAGRDFGGAMAAMLTEQRSAIEAQRVQYESSMRALAAELAGQNLAPSHLDAIERLSLNLEAALARVATLETRQAEGLRVEAGTRQHGLARGRVGGGTASRAAKGASKGGAGASKMCVVS